MWATVFVFQNNHDPPRFRREHHLSRAASNVRRHEAGGGGHGPLHHRPLLEPQEPHCSPGPHLPGHTPQPLPSQVLSSADQRVSCFLSSLSVTLSVSMEMALLFRPPGTVSEDSSLSGGGPSCHQCWPRPGCVCTRDVWLYCQLCHELNTRLYFKGF